ncbi:putative acetyltransferase [Actinacidiphila alni]|uniref:Putative acetyltransferase n=2 Tax=Actinacidiphila alni TaxID=380248 RepID=A0A1I2JBQ2_9ACTN|nr:putative acetyltransferase [Actinacidiphila alni]
MVSWSMRGELAIVRWAGGGPGDDGGVGRLLAGYHLRTEAEKGRAVVGVGELPERYRGEVVDPGAAFRGDAVLVAVSGGAAVGCVVVTAPDGGRAEIKRLWTEPEFRGRGVASGLVGAAIEHAAASGVSTVRLSVWEWRTGAVALYERLGFRVVESWDARDRLVCMERGTVPGRGAGEGAVGAVEEE